LCGEKYSATVKDSGKSFQTSPEKISRAREKIYTISFSVFCTPEYFHEIISGFFFNREKISFGPKITGQIFPFI